ncbi:MAG: DNA-directed polymerase subunit [Thermoplasmata archaeon]|jgi:DNA-directed RNA polymerase subunit N (RpoN/RPB10)|nr:DNA-directed polymerase subunit [Thermoplasmata archaeon]
MIIPVRCFTCGKVVGSAYEQYTQAVAKGKKSKEALDATGLTRFCCRRMLISHVDLIKEAAPYE